MSAGIIAYLGDGKRFSCGRKVGAYMGMVPTVSQTGKSAARLGHITKEGPSVMRRLLVLAAHAAVRSKEFNGCDLEEWFRRLARRRGKKIAIMALARKLGEICYALIRDGKKWEARSSRLVAA